LLFVKVYIYLIPISLFLFSEPSINYQEIKDDFMYFSSSEEDKIIIDYDKENSKEKNPFLACVLSGLVPGSGQIYSGNYKKGGILLGIEIASWVYRNHHNQKGDDYVDQYKAYAEEHWSFNNWVRNTPYFFDSDRPVFEAMSNEGMLVKPYGSSVSHHIEFTLNDNIYRTNTDTFLGWYEGADVCGNAVNSRIQCTDDNGNPNEFVNVEVLKDHHLYEGIGKYDMFFAGWDDVIECEEKIDGHCNYIKENNNISVAMSANKEYYQFDLRNNANKNYDYAENALTLIFINHALSIFDSFITHYVKNSDANYNYYTSPIYSKHKLEGINFSISW
tara:strand:+ start:933 stop:1928 length:996 start_codon:yes stop_codon:yes gene_type:complete